MGKLVLSQIIRWFPAFVLCLTLCGASFAQSVNPVYIEDSPRAAELLLRARLQASDNPGESARLLQELLDVYPLRLVPADDADHSRFVGVRARVLDVLRRNEDLRARYRSIETTEARRMLEARELDRLALTRSLTRPGLDALLILAQEALEEGRFRTALSRVDEAKRHPDIDEPLLRHALLLEGLAAHHSEQAVRAADALSRLVAAGADADSFTDYLREQLQTDPLAAPRSGTTIYDRAETEELDRLVTQAIWTAELAVTPPRDATPTASPLRPRRRLRPAIFESPGITATVSGSTVYVHEGSVIRAFNRFTARPIWAEPFRDPDPRFGDLRGEEAPGDLSLITVSGNRLVALSGQSEELGMMSHGAVVCVDAETGRMRWKIPFGLPASDMPDGLFPHGQPLVFEDRVYVLARQVTPERLTGTYVVCLDLQTGRPKWLRFVASSGNRSSISRPLSTLALLRDRLLITTPIGATALMHPETGEFDWLRRESVPAAFRETPGRIYEVNAPVVIDDRIYVLSADRRDVLVISAHTGHLEEQISAGTRDGWNNPTYLLGDHRYVYAIGSEIRTFDPSLPNRPLWSFPPFADPAVATAEARSAVRSSPVGRVQVTTDALLVPTRNGLFILDSETGDLVRQLEIDGPGHPVAAGAQLILATSDQLGSFMSIERAETMLRDRIAADPTDPQPAISLGQLGLRTDSLAMVLEAGELALIAAAKSNDETAARRDLFAVLLQTHRTFGSSFDADRPALYDMMARTAQHRVDRVEFLLAHAAWLTPHDPQAAAQRCRQILGDPELARVERAEDDVVRPAAWWATGRMSELVALHGPGVRAAEDARAEARFQTAIDADDERALIALSREFPASPAAISAALAAADLAAARQRRDQAQSYLIAALNRTPDLGAAEPIIVRLLSVTNEVHRAHLLSALITIMKDTPITIDGVTRSLADHAPRLTLTGTLPEIGDLQGPFQLLAGSLVPVAPGAQHPSAPADLLLLLDVDRIRSHDPEDLATRWESPLTDADVQLLSLGRDEILLFSPGRSNDPRFGDDPALISLDRHDGVVNWRSEPIDRLLNLPLMRARAVQELMPNQLPFDPTEIIATSFDARAYLVRRSGSALAFDLPGSGAPIWAVPRTLDQVHHAIATPAGLVLVGRERLDGLEPPRVEPLVIILDPVDGSVRSRIRPHTALGVTWARADGLGRLLLGSGEGIELLDVHAGERLWANRSAMLSESRAGWTGGSAAVAEDRTGLLHLIDMATGRIRSPLEPIVPGDWELSQVESVHPEPDATWLVRFAGRLVRYDAAGRVIGADAVGETRHFVGIVRTKRGPILLSLHDNRQVRLPGEDRLRMQRSYRLYPLHHDGRLGRETFALPPLLKRIQSFTGIPGWILLSTDSETMAIPAR